MASLRTAVPNCETACALKRWEAASLLTDTRGLRQALALAPYEDVIRVLVVLAACMSTSSTSHAGRIHDFLAHDTDSILVGVGGGDAGTQLSIMAWAYGLEIGLLASESTARRREGVDQLPTDDPLATAKGFTVGLSPFTYGSWYGQGAKHCPDSDDEFSSCHDIAYVQPYLRLKRMSVTVNDSSNDSSSLVIGSRAFYGAGPIRLGLYAQAEIWKHQDASRVSAGVLFGTGSYHASGEESRTPNVVRTVGGFGAIVLIMGAVGLVFGFLNDECSEPGKNCQS